MRSNRMPIAHLLLLLYLGNTLALECPIGWGENSKTIQIHPDRINDGYCDCPVTGADETETNACSGSARWPGIHSDAVIITPTFQCPQQPQLQLPYSQVQDGICDCCSGADEAAGVCEDICDQVLAAERKEAEKRLQSFQEGSLKRKEALTAFAELREKTVRDLESERNEEQSLESRLKEAKDQLAQLKKNRMEHRLEHMTTRTAMIAADPEIGILNGLSSTELSWMIVHACQAAGEVQAMFVSGDKEEKLDKNNLNNDLTTCVPLRLAGLDAGLIWESTTYKPKLAEEDADKVLLSELFDFNLQNMDSPVWTRQTLDKARSHKDKPQNRRRLTQVDPDDEDDSDDDTFEDIEEDDSRQKRERSRGKDPVKPIKKSEQEERRLKTEELILNQPFSRNRVSFRQKKETLVALMNTAKENAEKGDENNEEDGNKVGSDEPKRPMVDPMSFPFIQNKLDSRSSVVQRGLDYAVSAKVLIDELNASSLPDMHRLLQSLLIGTLIHGNLSSLHFWDLLVNVVPALQSTNNDESQTCRAPITCPPMSIQRGSIVIPVVAISKAVEEACIGFLQQAQQSCLLDEEEDSFPLDIQNGYGGLYVLDGRDESDIFHSVFRDLVLTDDNDTREELDKQNEMVSVLEEELEGLRSRISEMVDLVDGGNDGSYGPDGELYFLKDSCHSIESGKYKYELCLHGSATQSEGGPGGTNLGKWEGASVDDDGSRIWKWTNGAKCWNGPKRSATVHLTCGTENKLVSADEPDTCRYVFEMESYIACDESYRLRHGLPPSE